MHPNNTGVARPKKLPHPAGIAQFVGVGAWLYYDFAYATPFAIIRPILQGGSLDYAKSLLDTIGIFLTKCNS